MFSEKEIRCGSDSKDSTNQSKREREREREREIQSSSKLNQGKLEQVLLSYNQPSYNLDL